MAVGHDVRCAACGKPYHYAARSCEVCGAHYHPSGAAVRTCGRTCGVVLQRRNRMARGWIPAAQRPKPAPKPPRPPAELYAPRSSVTYYTCRYCRKLCAAGAAGQRREVCPALTCQMLRLKANNWRYRYGITQAEADAAVTGRGIVARSETHRCPGCQRRTGQFRWCEECTCTSVNASGRRCGNKAGADGRCEYHPHADGLLAAARQW
jgi:hypothetical protein